MHDLPRPNPPNSQRSEKPGGSGVTSLTAVAAGTSTAGRIAVEPMAPAEAFPRSFPPDATGCAPPPPPVRIGKLAGAPVPVPTPVGAAAPADDLPATPTSGAAPESFRTGDEAFATPRRLLESEVSFKSARGGGSSGRSRGGGSSDGASFRSAGPGSIAGSFVSVRSSASRRTSATSASRHESAAGYPQAFVPTANHADSDTSSEDGTAATAPPPAAAPPAPDAAPASVAASTQGAGSIRSRLSGLGTRALGTKRSS